MKKSCIIYDSWAELIENLPDEMAGQLIKMVLGYALGEGCNNSDNPAINAMFSMIRMKIDEDYEAYEETIKQRSEAGKRGMSKRWNNKSITNDNNVKEVITNDNGVITNDNNVKDEITKITVSVSDSVSVSDKDKKDILSVVGYLNEKLGTKYKANSKATSSQIKARLAEGHTVDDFKTVIDKKVKAWKDDPKMAAYLRPETLFCAKHFESYLNEIENRGSPKIHNYEERKYDWGKIEALVNDG